jgi:hypothetical protein
MLNLIDHVICDVLCLETKISSPTCIFLFYLELSSAGFISVKGNGKLAVLDIFSGRIEVMPSSILPTFLDIWFF